MFEKEYIHKEFKRDFLNYKVVYHCYKCGQKINTWWNEDYSVNGYFISSDVLYSEILDIEVNYPKNVICFKCMGM